MSSTLDPTMDLPGAVPRVPARELHGRPSIVAEILSIVRRRRLLIAAIIAAMLTIGLVYTLLAPRKYTAAALIEIQRERGSFIEVEGAQKSDSLADQEFYQTQYGLLQSQSLAERVANDLRLYDNTEFLTAAKILDTDAASLSRRALSSEERRSRTTAAATYLLRNFEIEPERFSRLVTIRFTGRDPALAKRVIDAWSADFVRMTLARRYEATAYARSFLEQRLQQLRTRINESERQLVAYASQQGIVNLPANSGGAAGQAAGERSLIADDLASLNQELSRAVADRVKAQSRTGSSDGAVSEAIGNPAISTLRNKRAELAADYAKMMVQFEPGYPPARALQRQIQQLDQSINREERRVQQTLSEEYRAAASREGALQNRIDSLKSGLLDFRRRSIQYNILQREVDTNRQLYDALLQRYKEIGVAGGVGVNNISVVDGAQLPTRPSSPKLLLTMAIALLAGLIVAGGVVFVLEQMNHGINDPEQVEEVLGVPLLGTVPTAPGSNMIELLGDRKTPISEAYLSIQTNLRFATDQGFPQILAITSTRAAEGKSTTAFALAHAMARLGGRVLLIDADMRSPSVHHLIDCTNAYGLSNFLAGEDDIDALIHRFTDGPAIMTAGPQPPSAAELLSGAGLKRLIQVLREQFDHVVFDMPPVMGLADAPLVASAVDGVVFVMQAGETHSTMAKAAIGRLSDAHARVFGAVLTKFDPKRATFGYGYDYGYGYGYGNAADARDS